MSFDLLLLVADCLGVFVFAVLGGIVAVRKDMDLLGAIVLGLVTAVGGGTLRDLVLGAPVFWLADQLALALGVAGALAAFLLYRRLEGLKPLRWADAIGLSVLSGAHLTLSERLLARLQQADVADVAVVVGGTIPARDAAALRAMGVRAVFPMGTPLPEIVSFFRSFRRAHA